MKEGSLTEIFSVMAPLPQLFIFLYALFLLSCLFHLRGNLFSQLPADLFLTGLHQNPDHRLRAAFADQHAA